MKTPICKNCEKEVKEWITASKTEKTIDKYHVLECPHCKHFNAISHTLQEGSSFGFHIVKVFPPEQS